MTVGHASKQAGNHPLAQWTDRHDEIIRANWRQKNDTDLAVMVGFSRQYVKQHRLALGLLRGDGSGSWVSPQCVWTDERVACLRELRAQGYSAPLIAKQMTERFGVTFTRDNVGNKCKRLQLPVPVRGVRIEAPRKAYKNRSASTARSYKPFRPLVLLFERGAKVPQSRMVALTELGENDCRFPIGDPAKPGFGFCGAPKFGGYSYCEAHTLLCYVPSYERRKAAA